jgi:hypothetical protein
MAGELETLLRRGPLLTGAAAQSLVEMYGISPAAARKRIQRREFPVKTLELPFARGAQFLYLATDYGSDRFWKALATALEDGNGAYARAIWALRARDGLIPLKHFAAAAAASHGTRQIRGHDLFGRLVTAGLLDEYDVPGVGPCAAFARGAGYADVHVPKVKARLIAEDVVLHAFKQWAQHLALGSFDLFALRDDPNAPRVSNFEWDLTAPSYLAPLATWGAEGGKPKQGFIAVDVLLQPAVTLDAVKPFVYKCQSLRKLARVGRCMPFFVGHHYSRDALDLLRKNGIIPATPEKLFGQEVAKMLLELVDVLTRAAETAVDPAAFATLFSSLGKIGGATGRMRGALFEFIAAETLRQAMLVSDVQMNRIYRENGKDAAEVDVQGVVRRQNAYFIECKGLLPGSLLDDKEVDGWLDRRIAIVRRHALESPDMQGVTMHFEMWVTGRLSPEAKARIAERQNTLRPNLYTLTVRYADDVGALIRKTKDKGLLEVFEQHFVKSPLAELVEPSLPRKKWSPFAAHDDDFSDVPVAETSDHRP